MDWADAGLHVPIFGVGSTALFRSISLWPGSDCGAGIRALGSTWNAASTQPQGRHRLSAQSCRADACSAPLGTQARSLHANLRRCSCMANCCDGRSMGTTTLCSPASDADQTFTSERRRRPQLLRFAPALCCTSRLPSEPYPPPLSARLRARCVGLGASTHLGVGAQHLQRWPESARRTQERLVLTSALGAHRTQSPRGPRHRRWWLGRSRMPACSGLADIGLGEIQQVGICLGPIRAAE